MLFSSLVNRAFVCHTCTFFICCILINDFIWSVGSALKNLINAVDNMYMQMLHIYIYIATYIEASYGRSTDISECTLCAFIIASIR